MFTGEFVTVFTTCEKQEEAHKIADGLVEKRLAACVQILGPITSIYRWKGKKETSTEWLCMIKTTQRLYAQLAAEISLLHSYETPEIIAFPIISGSEQYFSWLKDNVIEGS